MYNKNIFFMICCIITHTVLTKTYNIRRITIADIKPLQEVYQSVTQTSTTMALLPHEVTEEYIIDMVTHSINDGLGLVVETNDHQLIGWMIKYRYNFQTSKHVFYGGSIGIHPEYQGQGIGTKLISQFLAEVATNFPDILRVEIYALESNPAYHLYKRLGFVEEGFLKWGKLCTDGTLQSYYFMVWFNPNFKSN